MIVETGHFALILALALALIQSSVPIVGAARGERRLMAVAGPAALAEMVAILLSFLALTWAHVVSDFSVSVTLIVTVPGPKRSSARAPVVEYAMAALGGVRSESPATVVHDGAMPSDVLPAASTSRRITST